MFIVKAKINQERIENKINKTIKESGIEENRVKLVFDEDTMLLDILYDDNTLIDTINFTNYLCVDLGRV